jgi:hypothetical protein
MSTTSYEKDPLRKHPTATLGAYDPFLRVTKTLKRAITVAFSAPRHACLLCAYFADSYRCML